MHIARPIHRALIICCLGLSVIPAKGAPADDDPVRAFLRDKVGFNTREIRELDAGQAVARIIETKVREEVAVFGAVWIDVPKDFFIEQYRDIESFEGGNENVPQIGRFSDPPRLEDVARLTVDKDELKALPRCRPGDCEIKLPASIMARFRQEVDWKSSEAEAQANRLARQIMVQLIETYRKGGNAALGAYQDHARPVRVADEFRAMLENSPTLFAYLPELHHYLNDYPASQLPGSEEFFYWSKVRFGLKPTIRANHVTIYRSPESSPVAYALASKQVYSSHYFNTALELRFLVDDPRRAGSRGFFLLNMNRSRTDGLTGLSGRMIRSTVLNRTRDGMATYLRQSKQVLEQKYNRLTN